MVSPVAEAAESHGGTRMSRKNRGKVPGGRGTNCRCRCGCVIWSSGSRNSDICRPCEGYTVFGKWVEPKHTGSPEAEKKSGGRPRKDNRVRCQKCRVPVKLLNGQVVHEVGYYLWDRHEVEAVV